VKPPGDGDKAIAASTIQRIARLIEIYSADLGFADLRWLWELLQHFIGDEALIDAVSPSMNRIRMPLASATIWGKLSRERPHRSSCVFAP